MATKNVSVTVTVNIRREVDILVEALKRGAKVWGGGVQAQPREGGGWEVIYLVDDDEYGAEERRDLLTDPYSAVWVFIRLVDGGVTATITEKEVTAG
jgi:hypothetical protein